MKTEAMHLKESKRVYGMFWREEREGEDDLIIL